MVSLVILPALGSTEHSPLKIYIEVMSKSQGKLKYQNLLIINQYWFTILRIQGYKERPEPSLALTGL